MADDRDALIATLTEEGWEDITERVWMGLPPMSPCADMETPNGGLVSLYTFGDGAADLHPAKGLETNYPADTPNSVILAAARAAVEAEQ